MSITKHNYKQIAKELVTIVGEKNVLWHEVDLALYGCDAETLDYVAPDLVVLPGNTEQLQLVIKKANEFAISFTARGAGTGLSGGATTICGGISLVLTRMTKIIEIDPIERVAIVETGITNSAVSRAVAKYNLCFAPDPSSQQASTIGGNIAENAGGPHTLKYGTTVDHVLGMKVILPNGSMLDLGAKHPSSLGLNWIGLLTGSEGTLGVVAQATLRLIPLSERTETVLVYFPTLESGGEAVAKLISDGLVPCAMEMIDNLTINAVEDSFHLGLERQAAALLIIEIDGRDLDVAQEKQQIENILNKQNVLDYRWATSSHDRAAMWKARKAAFGALGRIAPHAYVLDGVVPCSQLAAAIRGIEVIGKKHSVVIANIFHAGDGNLHPALLYDRNNEQEVTRVLQASYEILKLCVDLGGALSGEHGIGIEKTRAMPFLFSPDDLDIMEGVKRSFDPNMMCNPGKIFPNLSICGESGMRSLLRHRISMGC